ncbi:MAG: peptidoglycan DD-metalloendopeptidase family protein [Chlorobium sp.]|nr:peptidoglycan DD-metalloendopeptidase family protein [Chlorobium sp.]
MRCTVLPNLVDRVLRIIVVVLLFVASMSSSTAAAPPVNSEISRIMRERTAVEENLRSLKQQLKEYQSKLNVTTRKESQSFKALENIRRQILVLERIISQNQSYLEKLDRDIDLLQRELQGNRQMYGKVSDDFRRTAVSVYKYGGNRDIEHLFSAGSVNNALVRTQYMGFFTRAVRRNVDQLQQVAAELENNRLTLEQSYKQKAAVVQEQERQLKSWSASKKEKEVVLDKLKKNKQEYAAQLADVQKKRQQLQSRIESLIIAEQRAMEAEQERQHKIAEAKRQAAKRLEAQRVAKEQREAKRMERQRLEAQRLEAQRREAQRTTSSREKVSGRPSVAEKKERRVEPVQPQEETLPSSPPPAPEKRRVEVVRTMDSPELEKVSADFDNAFGSLPWPVRNGVIAQKFGSVEDKDLKIVTTNNGIDISVPASTAVRAVSGGKVVQIAFLPTFGNIVIIRHPKSYLTVYANLGQLQVAKDDLIKSQQLIGVSGKMAEGGSVVHFEIWKGRVKQNPQKWLR